MVERTGDVPVSSRTRARMAQDKPKGTSSQSDTLATMVTLLQQQQQFMEHRVNQQLHEQQSLAAAAAQATQTSIRSASRTGNIAKKVATPTLSNPDSLTIAEFRAWKVRLRDFMDLNDGEYELRRPDSLRAFLRSVLETGWTRLWTAGRLGISPGDDFDIFLEKIDQYIRKKRSPLIDRRNFHHQDQLEGETVDSYFAALSRLHEACDFEDKQTCSSCYQDCDHHEVTANIGTGSCWACVIQTCSKK